MRVLKVLIISVLIILGVSACSSGVSQEEYDKLLAENEELRSQREELASTVSENLAAKADEVLKDLERAGAQAWATTSFGEETICTADGTNVIVTVNSSDTYSESTIKQSWNMVLESMKTFGFVSRSKGLFPYKSMSIEFRDPENKKIIEYVFDISDEGSPDAQAIFGNILDIQTVVDGLGLGLE